jgi:phosphopantothenoylcysteine decarboxylase/phosphopantothenate--cysteine ligase
MGLLEGKFVVLGVSGGIAAYRSCELARLLVKDGARVQVVLTEAAAEMVGPVTFQALTGRPAEVGRGGRLANAGMAHIDLGRDADLIIVAPATANTLAKIACGMADNLLTTTLLASVCPVILAPAMNTRMWENRLTQANMALLAQIERMHIEGPASGELACGESGDGRMLDPHDLFQAARAATSPQDLAGRRVLVTAGPTREPIDPVRDLTNRSSGKMGYALAAAAARRGADVVLISGPTALDRPWGTRRIDVVTAQQMAAAVTKHASRSHVVLMAAAVADFSPAKPARQKIKKKKGVPRIELKPTRDILGTLSRTKGKRVLVGFAAETSNPVLAAQQKRKDKKLDLVVANDVSLSDAGFDVDTNRVHLVDAKGTEELPLLTKEEVADRVLDRVVTRLPKSKK